MNVITLEAADEELHKAKQYYELQRPGLGLEFVEAFEEAMERVVAFPEAWGLIADKVRCCIFKRFEYGVIYVVRDETIFVLAVMHLKRRPGYWKRRLREIE
jgi:plasmid stabilization system protein ParE